MTKLGGTLLLSTLLLTSCLDPLGQSEHKNTDGNECDSDDDCATKLCGKVSHLCSHATCECPSKDCPALGEPSSDCRDGWACVYYKSLFESVGEVFLVEHDMNGGYCQPLCDGGCPEHYTCEGGRFCVADDHWLDPKVMLSWSGAVTGKLMGYQETTIQIEEDKSVMLMASATSPITDALTFNWNLVSSSGERAPSEGTTLEFSVPTGGYKRAELTVSDGMLHNVMVDVIFSACTKPGAECGFQGSGCCNGCDDATNTCK